MKGFIVDLTDAATWPDFIAAFNSGLIRHVAGHWNGNLDAFHDYMCWPDEDVYRLVLRGWERCFAELNSQQHHTGRPILELVLEVFRDNPHVELVFVPHPLPAFDVRWLTEAVTGVARWMDDESNLNALPILADALEEAGCHHAELLTACREPITLESGLWIVLWCLGRL